MQSDIRKIFGNKSNQNFCSDTSKKHQNNFSLLLIDEVFFKFFTFIIIFFCSVILFMNQILISGQRLDKFVPIQKFQLS